MTAAERSCRLASAPLELVLAARGGGAERCGLLFGRAARDEFDVVTALELVNRAEEPDRFRMDPAEVFRHASAQRVLGLELIGAWHTHPAVSAALSRHDRDGASEGWLSLIVGSDGELRAYEHGADGAACEILVVRAGQAPRPQ